MKKAAMFGKLNHFNYCNFRSAKAAMFGLDARIALAIFGALSVISGAVLYSAIQQAKVTALVTEMNELAKAYEEHFIDTGEELAFIDIINLNAAALVDNSIKPLNGWNGPYISYKTGRIGSPSIDTNLVNPNYGNVFFMKAKTSAWATPITAANIKCTNAQQCGIWVRFDRIPKDLAQKVNDYVDGSDSVLEGKARIEEFKGYFILYFLVKNTADLSVGSAIY